MYVIIEITTNGNGGKTDVGTWIVTYNNEKMWEDNFGSKLPINYRGLLPDGSYGILDSADVEQIDFMLSKIAEAKIDFIIFDETMNEIDVESERTIIKKISRSLWWRRRSLYILCTRTCKFDR